MPVRCLIAISHSLSRSCWPILPVCASRLPRDLVDLGQDVVERFGLDRGIVLQRNQELPLSLELLQDVGLQIGARGDVDDFEQREQRGVMIGRRRSPQ